MTLTNLNISIQEEDIGLFYQLLALYHSDRSKFGLAVDYAMGLNEPEGKDVPRTSSDSLPKSSLGNSLGEEKGFYASIIMDCTCGSCYNTFVRPTRTPWRSLGEGKFINSKYGTVHISGCQFANYSGPPGCVHQSLDSLNQERKVRHNLREDTLKEAADTMKLKKIEDEIVAKRNLADKSVEKDIRAEETMLSKLSDEIDEIAEALDTVTSKSDEIDHYNDRCKFVSGRVRRDNPHAPRISSLKSKLQRKKKELKQKQAKFTRKTVNTSSLPKRASNEQAAIEQAFDMNDALQDLGFNRFNIPTFNDCE